MPATLLPAQWSLSWVIVAMLVTALLVVVWCSAEHGATSPGEDSPSNTVQDTHKYYNLSVYQNNAAQSFDKNFIDMESAEIKHGNLGTQLRVTAVTSLIEETQAAEINHKSLERHSGNFPVNELKTLTWLKVN